MLTPERRLFTGAARQISETSIHTNLLRDLYATLGEGDAEKGWTIRLYWNPLAPWIWLGAGLCALGGFVSLTDRRLRIGAPEALAARTVRPRRRRRSLHRASGRSAIMSAWSGALPA